MNDKYAVYRKIKHDRAFKTLGKMSLWRVALGILLLIFVFIMTGTVSMLFANNGNFKAAERLIVTGWMDEYTPDRAAYFRAGARLQEGNAEAAYELLAEVEKPEAAIALRQAAAVELAAQKLEQGDEAAARELFAAVDAALLPETYAEAYAALAARLG